MMSDEDKYQESIGRAVKSALEKQRELRAIKDEARSEDYNAGLEDGKATAVKLAAKAYQKGYLEAQVLNSSETPTEREFWMVWNPARNVPVYRHHSEDLAISEARRIARLAPGDPIYVLHSTHCVTVGEEELRSVVDGVFADNDEIPF